MLCQTNGRAVKRESIVRKSKKDILRMLSPYLSLIALIGAPRSDAASGFPPGRGWLFSNDIFELGRLSSILQMPSSHFY